MTELCSFFKSDGEEIKFTLIRKGDTLVLQVHDNGKHIEIPTRDLHKFDSMLKVSAELADDYL